MYFNDKLKEIVEKRKEWEEYISNAVTDWEWELYRDR